jgi:hypothetical protein
VGDWRVLPLELAHHRTVRHPGPFEVGLRGPLLGVASTFMSITAVAFRTMNVVVIAQSSTSPSARAVASLVNLARQGTVAVIVLVFLRQLGP